MHRSLLPAALLAAALGAGCGDTQELTPVDPTPTEITEPAFTGTVAINGGVTIDFSVAAAGIVSTIVDSLQPSATAAIGVALGTWNGTSCEVRIFNDNAGVGGGVAGVANAPGRLCARAYDPGTLTAPATFSITIKHN